MAVEVGKVAIRAIPDTKGFRDKLQRALKKDAQNLPPIQVRLERVNLDRQKVRKSLQDQFDKLRGMRVDVDVDANVKRLRNQLEKSLEDAGGFDVVPTLDRVAIMRVNREIDDMIRDIEKSIDIDTNVGRNIRRSVNELERELRELNQMSLFDGLGDADFEYLHKHMARVKRELDEVRRKAVRVDEALDDVAEDRTVRLDVNPFTAWATARLNWLTRPRFVDIIPRVSKAALAKAAASIAALSGARLTWRYLDKFYTWMSDVDRKLPRLTAATLGITNAFSALMGTIAGIVGIGDGFAAMLPSLLLLPGLLAGAVMSGVALFVALKHSKEELEVLADDYNNLGAIIRRTFWTEARKPIIDFSNSVMPQLERSFEKTSRAIGRFTARLAGSFQREFGGGRLEAMFDGLAQSWDNLSTGTDAFARAITNLGLVAARYMPALANWFVRQSITFDNWLADVASDGRLDQWIKESVEAFYALWDVMAATTGIFQGLWKAASAAGYEGLRGFADMLLAWEKQVQGAKWQRTLTAMFRGARRAMQGVGDGLARFGALLDYLRGDLEYVLGTAGEIVGRLIGELSDAFARPEVARGLRDLIDGLGDGLRGLEPAFGPLADMFGQLGTFIGELARQLGPVLGEALQILAPAFTEILEALTPLLPQLSGALIDAFRELAPLVADLTAKFIDILPELIDFTEEVIRAAPTLVPLIGGALLLVGAVSKLVEWFSPLVKLVMDNDEWFGKLGGTVGGVAGAFARVFAWVGLVAAALVLAWENSGRFRDSIGRLGETLGKIIKPIGEMVGALFQGESAFGKILGVVGHLLSYVIDFVSILLGTFVPGLEYSAAAIGGLADGINKFFQGDWSGGWDSIVNGFESGRQRMIAANEDWLNQVGNLFTWDKGDEWGRRVGEGTSSGFAGSLTTDGVNLDQFNVLGQSASSWFYDGVSVTPGNAVNAPWASAPNIDASPFQTAGQTANEAFGSGFNAIPLSSILYKQGPSIDTAAFGSKGSEAANAFNASFSSSLSNSSAVVATPRIDVSAFGRAGSNAGQSFHNELLSAFARINMTGEAARIINSVTTGFVAGKSRPVQVAGSIGTDSMRALSNGAVGAWGVGASFGQGFAAGISSQVWAAARAAANLAAAAMRAAKNELDINSPSRAARDILGKGVGEGFSLGLIQSVPLVQRSMQSMVDLSGVSTPTSVSIADRVKVGSGGDGGGFPGIAGGNTVYFNVHNPVVRDPFEDDWTEANEKGLLG